MVSRTLQQRGRSTLQKRLVHQDKELIDRCIVNEPGAWATLVSRFSPVLLASIRAFLREAGKDSNLVEEIAARTWVLLISDDNRMLKKFDPSRGARFSTFLSVLAKSEARLLLRSERRRKVRECIASKPEIDGDSGLDQVKFVLRSDFAETLSPQERLYYTTNLSPDSGKTKKSVVTFTKMNSWQLRYRIRKKLQQFLDNF